MTFFNIPYIFHIEYIFVDLINSNITESEKDITMIEIKNLSKKEMKAVNGLAEVLIKQTANSACLGMMYQPQFPKAEEKFKQKNQ